VAASAFSCDKEACIRVSFPLISGTSKIQGKKFFFKKNQHYNLANTVG
jgi:hypothetical protein